MKTRYLNRILVLSTALLVVILGSDAAFAQGKGRGGDRGGGQPKAERQQGQRQQPQMQRQQQPRAEQRQQPQFQQQRRAERQQPRFEQRQQPQFQQQRRAERQQPRFEQRQQPQFQQQRRAERQQPRFEQRQQPQFQQQRRAERQQPRFEQRLRPIARPEIKRMEQRRPDFAQRDLKRSVRQQERLRMEGGQVNERIARERRNDRSSGDSPVGRTVQLNNAWPNNYGYERSTEVHARNAERKAWKDDERFASRNYQVERWFTERYVDPVDYRRNRYEYENRERWREDFLRNVVVSVLVGNSNYGDNYYSTYDPYYYAAPYDPAYYGSAYYDPYPSYAADPYSYYDPTFGYGYVSQPAPFAYYSDGYYDEFPYTYFTNSYAGDNYNRDVFGQLVTYGYDQGYNDGLAARQYGYGDRYYYDPYVFDNVVYDPYSFSLGENRRCLSKGYELGYMDALHGGRNYDPYNYGDINLVSMLLSTVSVLL